MHPIRGGFRDENQLLNAQGDLPKNLTSQPETDGELFFPWLTRSSLQHDLSLLCWPLRCRS